MLMVTGKVGYNQCELIGTRLNFIIPYGIQQPNDIISKFSIGAVRLSKHGSLARSYPPFPPEGFDHLRSNLYVIKGNVETGSYSSSHHDKKTCKER